MAANTRFATAVHVLVLLASNPDSLKTSSVMAEQLQTNAVVIRRILSLLQQADLIASQKGPAGGSRLTQPAKNISLADIYRAVEAGSALHIPVARGGGVVRINASLEKVYAEGRDCFLDALERTTLAQLLKRSNFAAKNTSAKHRTAKAKR
jgi:Rrf2 family protein